MCVRVRERVCVRVGERERTRERGAIRTTTLLIYFLPTQIFKPDIFGLLNILESSEKNSFIFFFFSPKKLKKTFL